LFAAGFERVFVATPKLDEGGVENQETGTVHISFFAFFRYDGLAHL